MFDSLTELVFSLTGLNAALFSGDGLLLAESAAFDLPDLLRDPTLTHRAPSDDNEQNINRVIRLEGKFMLEYLVREFADNELLVVGPFAEAGRQDAPLQLGKDGFPLSRRRTVEEMLNVVPKRDRGQIEAVASVMAIAEDLVPVKPVGIGVRDRGAAMPMPDNDLGNWSVQAIEKRYKLERKLRSAVARGDRTEIKRILDSSSGEFDFSTRLPHNLLRLQKNMTVILNTLLRLAAEKGGLHPVQLHALSEGFALQIEAGRTVEDLRALRTQMVYAYCDAVRRFSLSNYSRPVRRAVNYIHQYIDAPLSLQVLAGEAGCNQSYLSRQFRRETGSTITDYINRRRVEEAKLLLEEDDMTITDVAFRTGYDDANYFSRVFRRVAGMSPSEFRRDVFADRHDGLPIRKRGDAVKGET